MVIFQGNTYKLPIALEINGRTVTDKDAKTVEFCFGKLKKKYPEDVTFDGEHFIVPLSQEETFSFLPSGVYEYQARILFNDGNVKRTEPAEFTVIASQSKEVLV